MTYDRLKLFALRGSMALGEGVAGAMGIDLARHEEREFDDGEHKARPLESVRERDTYVLHSLYGDEARGVDARLVRLLFFIAALKDQGARRVTALIPYLCYARKDRRTKARDPLNNRYVAQLLESMGCDRVVVLDVHNLAAFENAFRRPAHPIEARGLFAAHFANRMAAGEPVVVSPDAGGTKRADRFREALQAVLDRDIPLAFVEKRRSAGKLSGGLVVGEVAARHAIVYDDIIATGGTLRLAAEALRRAGASAVSAAATHGLFRPGAEALLAELDQVVVTNSVPITDRLPASASRRLTVLDLAPLLACSISRLHRGQALPGLSEATPED